MKTTDRVLFSIIVPIYNVEKYIGKCIESILVQTYKDYELILVDDGSPDSCGKICDEMSKLHEKIRVIHKPNGGLSSARNAGLEIASGKYVIFLDSDDYWDDEKALENIASNLLESEADVLVFPAKRFYEDENKFTYILNIDADRNRIIDLNTEQAIRYMLENNIYRAAAWNKVIRKSIIDKYSMRFKEGYLSEDMDWCGDLLLYSKRFDFYDSPLYVYRQQREGSITEGKSEKLIADKLYMCKKGLKQAQQLSDKRMTELLASFYAYEYAVTLGVSSMLKNEKLLNQLKELEPLLQYDICKKVKMVNYLRKFVGYNMTRKILCLFVKIKH